MNKIILKVDNLNISYGAFSALKDVSFEVASGETVSIIGPNGAGKSTLIKSLIGLNKIDSGKIEIFNQELNSNVLNLIGYIPQFKTIDRNFPAKSLELVAAKIIGKWPSFIGSNLKSRALEVMSRFAAQDLANKQISALSGGELQRVFLARAAANNPKLLLLDEPATGIDAIGEIDLYDLLENYQKDENVTAIMVTHDWETAYHHSSMVLLLNKTVICFNKPDIAFEGENLRKTFGHIGHRHEMKIGVINDSRNI